MIQHKTKTTYSEYFDSLSEFYQTINARPTNEAFLTRKEILMSQCPDKKFTGTKSWEEAQTLATKGDPESVKLIKKELIKDETQTAHVVRDRTRVDMVGFAPCVPAYLAGRPANMINKRRTVLRAPKILNVAYSFGGHCDVSARDRIKAGASMISAINSLQAKGYRINLYLCHKSTDRSGTSSISQTIKVKDAGDHTQITSLAYPLINCSFFRRHVFRHMETIPATKTFLRPYVSCYGYSSEFRKGDFAGIKGKSTDNLTIISEQRIRIALRFNDEGHTISEIAANILAGRGLYCNE